MTETPVTRTREVMPGKRRDTESHSRRQEQKALKWTLQSCLARIFQSLQPGAETCAVGRLFGSAWKPKLRQQTTLGAKPHADSARCTTQLCSALSAAAHRRRREFSPVQTARQTARQGFSPARVYAGKNACTKRYPLLVKQIAEMVTTQ